MVDNGLTASVVIPAYEEEEFIGDALSSLAGQDATIIVVAAGEDDTLGVAERHPVSDVVLEDTVQEGWGAAVNLGLEEASGDIVAITDADTVVPEDWIATHMKHYRYEDVVGVSGPAPAMKQRPLRTGSLENSLRVLPMNLYQYYVLPWFWHTGLAWQGNNCSYRRQPLEEERFNEDMALLDDVEITSRMKQYGDLVFDATLRVRSSTRRVQEDGYTKHALTYLKGYWYYFIRDKYVDIDFH